MEDKDLVQTPPAPAIELSGHHDFEAKAREIWNRTMFMSSPPQIIAEIAAAIAEAVAWERGRVIAAFQGLKHVSLGDDLVHKITSDEAVRLIKASNSAIAQGLRASAQRQFEERSDTADQLAKALA